MSTREGEEKQFEGREDGNESQGKRGKKQQRSKRVKRAAKEAQGSGRLSKAGEVRSLKRKRTRTPVDRVVLPGLALEEDVVLPGSGHPLARKRQRVEDSGEQEGQGTNLLAALDAVAQGGDVNSSSNVSGAREGEAKTEMREGVETSLIYEAHGAQRFKGVFAGYAVWVDEPKAMDELFSKGFFGKGTLSRSVPEVGAGLVERGGPAGKRAGKRMAVNNLKKKLKAETQIDEEVYSLRRRLAELGKGQLDNEEALLMWKPLVWQEGDGVQWLSNGNVMEEEEALNSPGKLGPEEKMLEMLQLGLEEAYFLAYALGCLEICETSGERIGLGDLWRRCRDAVPRFVCRYVAYHYLRAKGWVVKSGIKFGTDFILYREGPVYTHSDYSVAVVEVDAKTGKQEGSARSQLDWLRVHSLNRVAEGVNKGVLIVYVLRPELDEAELESPECIRKFKVCLSTLHRWVPGESDDKE